MGSKRLQVWLLAGWLALACSGARPAELGPEAAPTRAPPETSAARSGSEPDASDGAAQLASGCAADPAREAPVEAMALGTGGIFVQVENGGTAALRVRLIAADGAPAVHGTLHIAAGRSARFLVGPGTYRLRARDERTCTVLEGTPFTLDERHRGVSIAIAFSYAEGGAHSLQPVEGPL